MAEPKYTVAIIGGGRLGQHYAEVYQTLPETELVAIAERIGPFFTISTNRRSGLAGTGPRGVHSEGYRPPSSPYGF